jgi:aryl-alcohol dehydrogenase-like predicted oxidoreductase
VDALVVHDLDHGYHGDELPRRFAELETGWRTLEALRDRGEVAALGFGVNEEELIEPILDRFAPDFLLVAMPYTCSTSGSARTRSSAAAQAERAS